MVSNGLKAPVFEDLRGDFVATLYGIGEQVSEQDKLLNFLSIPRTKKEISKFLGISNLRYLKEAYLSKLLEQNMIKMTVPDKPTSRNQKYVRTVTGTKGGPFFLE